MATVSAGSAATFSLAVGQTLVASTAGQAVVNRRAWQTGTSSEQATVLTGAPQWADAVVNRVIPPASGTGSLYLDDVTVAEW